jgi:putative copper export protein
MMFAIEAAVSGAGYLTLALAVGVLLVAAFFLNGPEDVVLRGKLSAGVPALFCAVFGLGLLAVIVQGAKLSGGAFPSSDVLIRYLTRTQSGRIWLAREIYLLALLLISVWLLRKGPQLRNLRLTFFLLLPFVASRGLTGHAVAVRDNTALMLIADAIHMVAVAVWAGGLPVLCWALWKGTSEMQFSLTWAAELVRRFSHVALTSVGILVLSGLYQSLTHVQDLPTLFNTPYGNVLSLKLALFALMVALGALNRFSTKPQLARAAVASSKNRADWKVFYRIGGEGLLGGLVLVATGFLTTLPPGAHSLHARAQPQSSPSFQSHVHAQAPEIRRSPAEGAAVTILTPAQGQTFSGDRVPLKFNLNKGKRGHHVHAYVDGELMGMFETRGGTLNGIKPGQHTLELRVVMADHRTELDATDKVTFMTK